LKGTEAGGFSNPISYSKKLLFKPDSSQNAITSRKVRIEKGQELKLTILI
jgi:hypothetical protein